MLPRLLSLLLALGMLSACESSEVRAGSEFAPHAGAADELRAREVEPPCSWECQACPTDAPCTQECVAAGSCESSCGLYLQCAQGYSWSEASCACTADADASELALL